MTLLITMPWTPLSVCSMSLLGTAICSVGTLMVTGLLGAVVVTGSVDTLMVAGLVGAVVVTGLVDVVVVAGSVGALVVAGLNTSTWPSLEGRSRQTDRGCTERAVATTWNHRGRTRGACPVCGTPT